MFCNNYCIVPIAVLSHSFVSRRIGCHTNKNSRHHTDDTRETNYLQALQRKNPSGEAYRAHCSTCKPYACNQCDMAFKTTGLLDEHRASKHGVPISCDVCSKVSTSVWTRDRHHRIQHTDSPQYACLCGYKFQDEKKLRSHQEDCVLSKPGATRAIKRRFEELSFCYIPATP